MDRRRAGPRDGLLRTFQRYKHRRSRQHGQAGGHNRGIEASFKRADRIVAAFKNRTGRLPSYGSDFPTPIGDVVIVDLSIAGWDGPDVMEALKVLGQPPKGAYLLTADWNEEPEFYAPWSGKSTLSFNPDHYSVSGRLWLDVTVSWIVTAILAFATVRAFVAWQPKRSEIP